MENQEIFKDDLGYAIVMKKTKNESNSADRKQCVIDTNENSQNDQSIDNIVELTEDKEILEITSYYKSMKPSYIEMNLKNGSIEKQNDGIALIRKEDAYENQYLTRQISDATTVSVTSSFHTAHNSSNLNSPIDSILYSRCPNEGIHIYEKCKNDVGNDREIYVVRYVQENKNSLANDHYTENGLDGILSAQSSKNRFSCLSKKKSFNMLFTSSTIITILIYVFSIIHILFSRVGVMSTSEIVFVTFLFIFVILLNSLQLKNRNKGRESGTGISNIFINIAAILCDIMMPLVFFNIFKDRCRTHT
ncbi:hypothetical protein EDEG_03604 [Edhazardia aedis USNM 41457]|uniref:Uncharacterized protein n=1 Tax=Edhazardia aedis (strain USNM 41457) TaxID=1003232 RepID=J9DH49_EDHAE|nr:hypothetical protein EDEG_03604 [Edhazardia aedis USNM 41457]|eukprot:EJW01930.1 hypothetical protein EDEG_03604 [Edhazardia aedis USNM 41457]